MGRAIPKEGRAQAAEATHDCGDWQIEIAHTKPPPQVTAHPGGAICHGTKPLRMGIPEPDGFRWEIFLNGFEDSAAEIYCYRPPCRKSEQLCHSCRPTKRAYSQWGLQICRRMPSRPGKSEFARLLFLFARAVCAAYPFRHNINAFNNECAINQHTFRASLITSSYLDCLADRQSCAEE